jgi:choline-sulfatase
VDVGFYGYPPLDVRTAGLPKDWVIRVSQDLPFSGEDHHDNFCASKAIEWLGRAPAGRPWFLQVNFSGPHEPFDPPAEYGAKYWKAEVPEPIPADLTGKPRNMQERFITDDRESIRYTQRQYCAMIEHLDAQVGRLLKTVEERGELENTVIIFTADHGEMLGDFGLYTKHVPYEASARIPMMMCGPGIAAGRRSDALVELMDLNPTCCQIAGLPGQADIDARSMMPLVQEKAEPSAARENAAMVMYCFAALRTRKWKYARHYNDLEELYDLEADPQERHNLIAEPAGQREHTALRWKLLGELNGRMNEGKWMR